MADPFDTPGYRYSVNRFPGDGATTTWNLSFAGMDGQYAGYISKTHVKAYTILDSTGEETPLPLPSTAFIGPTTLKIEPAIPAGTTLVVYRDTPKNAPLLDYVDGALMIEKNLDTSNQQAIYAVAEMVDRFADALEDMEEFTLTLLDRMGQVEDVSNEAHDTADLALSASNTAMAQATAAVQTSQDALAGVTGATQAAIDATAAANAANAAAATATTAANNANQAATDALDTSSQALTTAQAAETTANGIDAKATQALADAADAVATANGVDAKAQDALDTANSADTKADTAISTANTAEATANGAQALAQQGVDDAASAAALATIADGKAVAAQSTADSAAAAAAAAQGDVDSLALSLAVESLQWLGTPIGGYITPLTPPPTDDPRFRYVLCTAGETGPGGYNDGVLTSESVMGTAPLVEATAVVDLDGSPFDGLTIHLINTEGRFVGAGAAEAFEDDSLQNITGRLRIGTQAGLINDSPGAVAEGAFARGTKVTAGGSSGSSTLESFEVLFDASLVARTSDHTQPRAHRLPHYRRIL